MNDNRMKDQLNAAFAHVDARDWSALAAAMLGILAEHYPHEPIDPNSMSWERVAVYYDIRAALLVSGSTRPAADIESICRSALTLAIGLLVA